MFNVAPGLRLLAGVLQMLFMVAFAAAALFMAIYSGLCAAGSAQWLVLPLQFGDAIFDAGIYVQLGVTALALGLVVYLPANRRILALETSHRDFAIHMEDVAQAYSAVHRADRRGAFLLSHEFDAVKERIAYLRDHPDLGMLEPDVLEVAAQMGVISRELAEIYSDERVDRARTFLIQRQEEIANFQEQLTEAKAVAVDIQNWAARVEIEEDVARSELSRLSAVLDDILPELPPGLADTDEEELELPDNTISLLDRQAAE